ncbi:hypothetical protein EWB00_001894 [Schistosoma japonicum]|uniref:Uncharacterized protein n=1 Tax=Schistosoma japonicum TaxID=6182 RepID=A0A4Z2DDY5_SCHJA|nr:hypothetical protein EWB00_001894 [Schistosoma japonicum]
MEDSLQEKKNNLIETSEQLINQTNSPVDENSLLISRTTEAVRDYLEYDFECLLADIDVLTRMNQASTERYMEITTSTNDMTRKLVDVNNRCKSIAIYVITFSLFNEFISKYALLMELKINMVIITRDLCSPAVIHLRSTVIYLTLSHTVCFKASGTTQLLDCNK